jgi:hypothetical protein
VCWSSTKGTSPHRNVTCSRRDIAEQSAHMALNNNHSLS